MLVDGSAQKPMISVCLLNVLNILLPVCLCCKLKQIFCCCSKITMKTDWQSRTSRSFLKKLLLQSSTKSATFSNYLTKLFGFSVLKTKLKKLYSPICGFLVQIWRLFMTENCSYQFYFCNFRRKHFICQI